jgi:hypothetical protein
MMSSHHRVFLPLRIAGGLCCAALIGISGAHADVNNLTLPGLNEKPFSPGTSFTRMFPSLPPFASQTDEVRECVKQLGAQGGLIDALDILTDPIQSITNPGMFSLSRSNAAVQKFVVFLGSVGGGCCCNACRA